MSLGSFWMHTWWVTAGLFGATLLWWLVDRLFLRDTETPKRLIAAEAQIQELQAVDTLRTAEVEALQGQARTAQIRAIEISSLKAQLEDRKTLEQTLEAEYAKVVAAGEAKANEVKTLSAEVAKLQAELTAARTSETAPHPEVDALKQQVATLTAAAEDASDLKLEHELLQRSAAAQKIELERIKAEWAKASEHSARTAMLQLDLDQKTERTRRLEGEIETMKAVLLDSKHALERQAAEIGRLKSEFGNSAQSSGDVARLTVELTASRASEERLRAELTAATVRIANLERLRLALDAARQAAADFAATEDTSAKT